MLTLFVVVAVVLILLNDHWTFAHSLSRVRFVAWYSGKICDYYAWRQKAGWLVRYFEHEHEQAVNYLLTTAFEQEQWRHYSVVHEHKVR